MACKQMSRAEANAGAISRDFSLGDVRDARLASYLDELVRDMRDLNNAPSLQQTAPHALRLLAEEIDRVWSLHYSLPRSDGSPESEEGKEEEVEEKKEMAVTKEAGGEWPRSGRPSIPVPPQETALDFVVATPSSSSRHPPHRPRHHREVSYTQKIEIPAKDYDCCNLIGRILGPSGITVRKLEADTGCRILIRGEGSVKDPVREMSLRNRKGYEHLSEPLHVLITASHPFVERIARNKLRRAADAIKELIHHDHRCNDDHKRDQLVQLAIINGTYRAPSVVSPPQLSSSSPPWLLTTPSLVCPPPFPYGDFDSSFASTRQQPRYRQPYNARCSRLS